MPLPLPLDWLDAPEEPGLPFPPEFPSLRLRFQSFSVTIPYLIKFEKAKLTGYQLESNFFGATILKAQPYKPKWTWSITALCEQWQRDRIYAIISQSHQTLITPPYTDFEVSLDDVCSPEIEETTTYTPVALSDPWEDTVEGGATKYFATYNVGIPLDTLKEVNRGTYYDVEFTMIEV